MRFRVPARGRCPASFGAAFAFALALTGCLRADRAADRQIAAMQEAIGDIQADRDRATEALIEPSPESARPSPARRAGVPPSPAAAPRTVQIGDADDGFEPADPNDPASRPEIRLYGASSPRPIRSKTSRDTGAEVERDVGPAGAKENR